MSKKWWQSEIEGLGKLAETIIGIVIGVLAGFGLLSWVILFLINPNNPLLGSTTSIALAPAVAIFGVFGWTGGTSLKSSPTLRAKLRQIGILYTATALLLVIMGMLLPVIEVTDTSTTGYCILAVVYVALTFVSAFAFGGGTGMLVSVLVSLWRFQDEPQSP